MKAFRRTTGPPHSHRPPFFDDAAPDFPARGFDQALKVAPMIHHGPVEHADRTEQFLILLTGHYKQRRSEDEKRGGDHEAGRLLSMINRG
jgi:hypothetical protein